MTMLVVAQIHLLDEGAQRDRQIDLDLHVPKTGERDGDDHVVGLDLVVGREDQPKTGSRGLDPAQYAMQLDLSRQRRAESLDDLAGAALDHELLVAGTQKLDPVSCHGRQHEDQLQGGRILGFDAIFGAHGMLEERAHERRADLVGVAGRGTL